MQTTDLGLRLYEGTDKFNPLLVENENINDITDEILSLQEDSITVATELKTGTVHALTRENPNTAVMRFTATANWTTGDTITVDGVQVSALLPNGGTIGDGAYVIGSEVLCALVGTRLTVYVTGVVDADNSARLGGELPEYYGTASDTAQALATAQASSTVAQAAQTQVTQINSDLESLKSYSEYERVVGTFNSKQVYEKTIIYNGTLADGTVIDSGLTSSYIDKVLEFSITLGRMGSALFDINPFFYDLIVSPNGLYLNKNTTITSPNFNSASCLIRYTKNN